MAAIHPPSSNHSEPLVRCGHCSAFVNGKIFMYGGLITGPWLTQPPTVVDVFDPATEKWDQITTTGPPPPGFIYASCAVIGLYLYAFAGGDGSSYFNNMQELNTTNLKWNQLNDANQGEAPMAKAGAAMISYKEKILITIGGIGFLPSHRRSGTEYILDPDSPGHGWTNELLCFDVNSRTWSSPHTTGTPPPASTAHSFTMVDLYRAVLYGGVQQHRLLPSHVYVLDVQQWMWTTITGGGPSWPVARSGHSAVSLHHPGSDFIPDPAVMVMWGCTSGVVLSDCWVFQVNARQWRKVTLPDTLKGRYWHSTTIVHTGSTLKKLVNYGGMYEFPRNPRDPGTYFPVAETTVIEIESLMDVWVVTAVCQLGRRSVPSRPPTVLPVANSQVDRLLEKYRPQGMIRYKSLKCLFTGPPRVGKTTLKRRLLKIITNLISSSVFSKSGGLEKPITVITGEARECATVLIDPNHIDWQVQPNPIDEAQTVMLFIDQQTTPNQENTSEELHSHASFKAGTLPESLHSHVSFKAGTLPESLHSHVSFKAGTLPESLDVISTPSEIHPTQYPPPSNETKTASLDDAKKLMEKFLASKGLRSIKDIEKTMTIYFVDSGGQPEFHEIMPLILQGPALHMVFFNLAFNLDEHIPVRFCQEDGTDAQITYESSYTGMQMIYQLLSSLYCLSKESSMHSRAILIGTHLDELKAEKGEKGVTEINKSINQLLDNAEFLDKGFVTYPKKKSSDGEEEMVFVPVDNYSGSKEEIDELQEFMKQVFKGCFDSLELPSAWHIFHLVLRDHYGETGVCSLAECEALARGCGLDKDDVLQVLRYIHRHLGTVLYYEEVQGLRKLVICNPNVLFQGIFHLVAASFAGEKAYHTLATEIRKTGEIPVDILDHVNAQHTQPPLKNKHIFELLEHFKILTQLPSGSYFMPCLLLPDKSLKLSCEMLKTLSVCPLLVRFDGNYIPIGVFSALVVELSQKPWELDTKDRYRNRISFFTDGFFSVRLIVYPAYLEFRIPTYDKEEPKKMHQFCMGVRKRVVDALKSVLKVHEHTKKTKFHLGFYCPGETDGQPHFSECKPEGEYDNPKTFVCSKSPRCYEQRQLDQECSMWFENWKDPKTTGGVHDREMLDPGNTTSRVARDCVPDHDAGLGKRAQKRRRKQVEDHRNGKSKREKLSISPEIQTDISEAVLPSSSENAGTPMAAEVDKLDQDSHIEITGYLLGLDKTHIYHLGLVLGLSEPRVRGMEDSKTFLDDMVAAWLQKVDQVQKRGAPSWRRLVEALSHRTVGQNGISSKIIQDRKIK